MSDSLSDIPLFLKNTQIYFSNSINFLLTTPLSDYILNAQDFICLFSFFLFWLACYFYVHYFIPVNHDSEKKILDTKNRIISIFHASTIYLLCLYDFLYLQNDKCGEKNSRFQNLVLLASCGYFLYDLFISWVMDIVDYQMVLHHIAVSSGLYFGALFQNSATEMMRAMIAAECSNPAMHIRLILKNHKMKYTKAYLALELYYILSYTLARLIFGFKIVVFTVFCMDNLLLVKIAGTVVWLQSFVFMFRMAGILKTRYEERKARKGSGIQMFWFRVNEELDEFFDKVFDQSKRKEKYIP